MNERTLRILEYDRIIEKLAGMASSAPGKHLAGKLVPDADRAMVAAMQKETSDAVGLVLRRGSPPLGGIHDMHGILKRVGSGGILNPSELLKTADTLRACRNLRSYAGDEKDRDAGNVVVSLIGSLMTDKGMEDRIYRSISDDGEVSDGASSALSGIRRQIRTLQDSIKDKLNEFVRSSKYQKYMQEPLVTMRGDRYVVPVRQEYKAEVPGMVHDASASGATLFIEPMAVVEANNDIRQLRVKEKIEIDRILAELTSEVGDILQNLAADFEMLARLDFIFAKARLGLDLNCAPPKLSEGRSINIRKGRHPLLDKNTVVPIDLWLGSDFDTLVITGPNTGGKTVTLKTIGLFCLMAQSGLHIPASEGTELPVFRKIFADIGDEQSIEQSLSTFSSHMRNIVGILGEADGDSLVLFDELGAGTDPAEGAALAKAILETLHARGAVTAATTHYSELKIFALATEGICNACCEFDVETLRPTYRLLIGVPGKSNAFAISRRLGLPEDILSKAKELLSEEDIRFEDVLMTIEKNRSESEQERIRIQVQRMESDKLRVELEDQKKKISQQREGIIREAREEARRIILSAREETEALLTQLRRLEHEQEASERNKAAEEIRNRIRKKAGKIEESLAEPLMPKRGYSKPPQDLKPGDSVIIQNLDKKGTVLTPPDKDGEAVIQVGIMKINAHITNLRLCEPPDETAAREGAVKAGIAKSRSISPELDLRGMTLDEAVERVDKYLDDAGLAGLHEVVIIHGKGTGVLRSGIHKFLKGNGHVKSFRLGAFGEGDAGVTLVEL